MVETEKQGKVQLEEENKVEDDGNMRTGEIQRLSKEK